MSCLYSVRDAQPEPLGPAVGSSLWQLAMSLGVSYRVKAIGEGEGGVAWEELVKLYLERKCDKTRL